MFEPNKSRYLTRGVNESISPELCSFMWFMIDNMPEPKDYLQVFNLADIQQGILVQNNEKCRQICLSSGLCEVALNLYVHLILSMIRKFIMSFTIILHPTECTISFY